MGRVGQEMGRHWHGREGEGGGEQGWGVRRIGSCIGDRARAGTRDRASTREGRADCMIMGERRRLGGYGTTTSSMAIVVVVAAVVVAVTKACSRGRGG